MVEDEHKLAKALQSTLESERYVVDVCYDGQEGYEQASVEEYDLIVLDIGLPHMDGFEVCRQLRKDGINTPVLMLTARDGVSDRVAGLDSGADDYLVKPFEVEEMLARVRALLRRRADSNNPILKIGSLTLDPQTQQVTRAGKSVELSAKEYALLEFFMRHPNFILSKQKLLDRVWGDEVDPFSNVIDVYVGYLRKKIDKAFPKETPLLQTRKGMGYSLGIGQ